MNRTEKCVVLPEELEELKTFALAHYQKAREWEEAHERKAEEYTQKELAYEQKVREYRELEDKYRILSHAFYGRSSEKWSGDERLQASLFNEAELAVSEAETEGTEAQEIHGYKRRNRGKRKPIADAIPREEVLHDIAEEEKTCGCGEPLVRIGEERSEKLEIIPARIKVLRHVRPKYACRVCEGSGDERNPAVRIAPAPEELLPKSVAAAGLVSHIITSKYCDALPLYRQESMFRRIGVQIGRASMARWIIELGGRLSPLLDVMDEKILHGPVTQMDETRIQVHKEAGRENHTQSFMWVVRGGPPSSPLIRYMYHATRSGEVARAYLAGYRGYLQTDGYEAYSRIGEQEGIIHVGCLAHARRKFDDATKVSGGSPAALEFISLIQKIYRVEKDLRSRELSEEEFVRVRKERATPLFEKLEKHLEKKIAQAAPSTALGKALRYLQEILPRIKRYLESPYLTPDTNAVERAIRPFAVGRKNWIFADTPRGAHASAAFYSLIESAKSASLEPYWYIRHVLQKLPEIERTGKWEDLSPANLNPNMLLIPSS